MKASRVTLLLGVLGAGLVLLVSLVGDTIAVRDRDAFVANARMGATVLVAQVEATSGQHVAVPRGATACYRSAARVRSIDPASDCSWFTPETADAVGSKTVVVVADGVRGVLGLRIPAAPLTAQTATARSLVFGGGGALFLVLAGLLVYSAKHQDITIATTTVLLEALAGGDLSARASEVGTAEERRALAAGNAVAERLQVTVERQRTFLADAAHQLRNPLLALQLRLENLEPYVLAKGRRGYSRLTQDVERLGTTLDDLVAFARATETDGEPREVDVLAVVDERLRAWVSVAHSRKIVLRQRLPRVAVALARPGALEQALDVLVDNALKHAPQRSEVTVVVVPTATYVEVRVEDRGRGLPAGAQAAAAVRGWRRDPRAAGSGLGLAIATLLLSSSGGSLQLGDRLDGPGLSATLRLPTPAPTVDDELLPAWTQGSQGSAGWRED